MIYNHLTITVRTHWATGDVKQQRIVGFEVEPRSINNSGTRLHDFNTNNQVQFLEAGKEV